MKKYAGYIFLGIGVIAIVVALIYGTGGKGGTITNVDTAGFLKAQSEGAKALDVRTGTEYMDGHIPGAILIEEGTYAEALKDYPRDDAYIVYCRTGNRSSTVVNWMKSNGFTNIYHLNQGIVSWTGDVVQGIEPGEPNFSTGEQPPLVPADVSDIELIAPTDERAVLVQFSTTT